MEISLKGIEETPFDPLAKLFPKHKRALASSKYMAILVERSEGADEGESLMK